MSGKLSILLLAIVLIAVGCNTHKGVPNVTATTAAYNDPHSGAIVEGMAINIDGTLWHADTYGINQLGEFWVVKGTASDASVFSIMLPDIKETREYKVLQGGEVSVTYSTDRSKGFLFFAPFAENNGWVKIEVTDGYLRGNLEVTLSNGAIPKKCTGMFTIKLP